MMEIPAAIFDWLRKNGRDVARCAKALERIAEELAAIREEMEADREKEESE